MCQVHFLKTHSPTSAALTARLAGFGVFQKQLRRMSTLDVAPPGDLRRPFKIPRPTSAAPDGAASLAPEFFRGDSGSRRRIPQLRLNAYVTP